MKSKPKIIVLVGSSGSGHVRAGQVLAHAFRDHSKSTTVEVVDSYDFLTAFTRWLYQKAFLWTIYYAPALYRWGYSAIVDREDVAKTVKEQYPRAVRKFSQYLDQEKPDIILTTHPFGTMLAAAAKKGNILLGQVMTDFHFHLLRRDKNVDRYYIPLPQIKNQLLASGVRANQIMVSGIPIEPFSSIPGNGKGANPLRVLIMRGSGEARSRREQDLVRALLKLTPAPEVEVITGKDAALLKILLSLGEEGLTVHGHLEPKRVWERLCAADLFIGKPGGLSISEAMAASLPVAIFEPVAGHEERNAEVLEKIGVAKLHKDISSVANWVGTFGENRNLLAQETKRVQSLAKPEAARNIVRDVLAQFRSRSSGK